MTSPQYRFSDDLAVMDRIEIHRWLSTQSYWAEGRSRSVNDTAMENSLNFGLFDTTNGTQVAYARVITDRATFAWLADVFVTPEVRGHGVGTALVQHVIEYLEQLDLKRIALRTKDAHSLYEKFGFTELTDPERWMTRLAV
jgi:GNAT superfamily N-acetyltransferase